MDRTLVLAPNAVAGGKPPVRPEAAHGGDSALPAVLYRRGQYQESVHRLEELLKAHDRDAVPQELYFLAMARHHLGQAAEAREYLGEAIQAERQGGRQPRLLAKAEHRRECERLRQEAEALLQPRH